MLWDTPKRIQFGFCSSPLLWRIVGSRQKETTCHRKLKLARNTFVSRKLKTVAMKSWTKEFLLGAQQCNTLFEWSSTRHIEQLPLCSLSPLKQQRQTDRSLFLHFSLHQKKKKSILSGRGSFDNMTATCHSHRGRGGSLLSNLGLLWNQNGLSIF